VFIHPTYIHNIEHAYKILLLESMRCRTQPMSRGVELIGVVAAYNLQCASIFNNLTALRQLFLTHTHTHSLKYPVCTMKMLYSRLTSSIKSLDRLKFWNFTFSPF